MPLDAVAISWASVSVNAPKCLDLLQGYQTGNFFSLLLSIYNFYPGICLQIFAKEMVFTKL